MNDLLKNAQAAAADKPLKIISLVAENVKRLHAVEIKPDGNLVEITGRNAQGKSSILDAIHWAMKGRGAVQATPIRKGQEKAHIKLDLGDYIVTRTFNAGKDGADFTTSIKVEAANGFRASSPQQLLDGLMGELSIDPLAFMRMKPGDQADMLRGFVVGFDFAQHERERQKLFEQRTEANRAAKAARAAAHEIVAPSDLPAEMLDEAALSDELARAGEHNGSIEGRRSARAAAQEKIAELRASADRTEAALPRSIEAIETKCNAAVADIDRQIEALKRRQEELVAGGAIEISDARREAEADAAKERAEADALQRRLDGAGPLPEPIDIADVQHRLAEARDINQGIRQRTLRDRQIEIASAAEKRAQDLTDGIVALDKAKGAAIAAAKLPVAGIEFDTGALLLNGLPLDQASDAEQLRVSVAIAMALQPKLRVIRVRDGNVLDADGMRLLAEIATEHDAQVWVETVRHDDRVAFIIEDGRVRQPDVAAAAE